MRILELFAGTRSIGKGFQRSGIPRSDILSVELDHIHPDIDWYRDINTVQVSEIVDHFGVPDVIWASPPCQSYSIAAISRHRYKDQDGHLRPKSEFAEVSDRLLIHTIENPRGGMRKTEYLEDLPRYTITYCQYGDHRMKPTDIWTNHPDPQFRPMCHNGDPCHARAPRGAKTGTQGLENAIERSRIPDEFCDHIAAICREMIT